MKKLGFTVALGFLMVACSNSETAADVRMDSVSRSVDTAANHTWDSTKQKAADIRQRVEDRLSDTTTVQ